MAALPYEISIALRYLRGSRARSLPFLSVIAALGIIIGIATLILALSVFSGFEREVRARILSAVAHVAITPISGQFDDWRAVGERVGRHPDVAAYAPYIGEQGIVARGQTMRGVAVRGVLPAQEGDVSDFGSVMTSGSLDALKAGAAGLVVGSAIAEALDLQVGSRVSVVVPRSYAALQALPRFKSFTVVGVFRLDMYEYDNGVVIMHLDDAAELYGVAGATGLRLRLDNLDAAPVVARELGGTLGLEYRVRDWTQEHRIYFEALQMQKAVIFVILLLIVAVAMFNVVSTLVVFVTQKKADIAILRTLGATDTSIVWVFVIYGGVLGMLGTLLGTGLGVLLALNLETIVQGIERLFNTSFLAADVYLISEVPSDLRWRDVALIAGSAMCLALISALYPARRAAHVQPAEALRYE